MSKIITSTADAEAHIAKIRHDKGLTEGSFAGHNVSDLENALTTLAEQLYQSSTHFLLELIQNADDNSYASEVQPTVHFTYANGTLRVDCNEVGFTPQNVEAICRVGQSTKKGGLNSTRYVGEKGIGFKSVFKAADVVWVSSGPYSFKFDKSKQLGMIAPIWSEFPALKKPGFTSIFLQLSTDFNRRGLLDELRSLDSRLLIFLRRLRSINVTISEPMRRTWKNTFSRSEIGSDLIRLKEYDRTCDYIIKRHQVSDLPPEPKRQGVTSTEIILGFPITSDGQPKRESQQAYAFLPIRDYGFEFLIQADFLLIASREDIDDSSQWNHALRSAFSTAFVKCMIDFNNDSRLRYLWPRYLPTREPLDSFLKPFHLDLRERLAGERVLESQSETLVTPKSSIAVPDKFTIDGVPITSTRSNSLRYLSTRYLTSDLKYLNEIQVVEMDNVTFMMDLAVFIRTSLAAFKAKPNSWHSKLASLLSQFGSEHHPQLSTMQLVPLSDGSWVGSKGRRILFPSNKSNFDMPGGLELSVVATIAAVDPERRKLYKILGVGDLEELPVMQHIEELHASGRVAVSSVPRSALVSQIRFLYSNGWKSATYQRFWFTSESGQRLPGSQLYQDSEKPHSATKFLGAHRKKFQFIHKDYVAAAGKDTVAWMAWLENKMDVATMPRLVQRSSDGGYNLSDDFGFIIKNFPSSEVLLLLRDNWEEYARFIIPEQMDRGTRDNMELKYSALKINESGIRLKAKLSTTLVTCKDGKKYQLNSTFIPTRDLLVASHDGVPFVDIPYADDISWKMLELLGVSIKVDVTFYLRCLQGMEGSNDEDRVMKLLDSIQYRCGDEKDAALVRKQFASGRMVYIPATENSTSSSPSKWIALKECRWMGMRNLRTFESLDAIYPADKRLFWEILGVRDATLNDLVEEAKQFQIGDSLKQITTIFHKMEKMMEDDTNVSRVPLQALRHSKAFPVTTNWEKESERVSTLKNWSTVPEWFVADTAKLRTTFAGVVPLLDIKVDDLTQMDQVLHHLHMKSRFLSNAATSKPKVKGAIEFDQELTDKIRSKVDFIVRLLPYSKQRRAKRREVVKQLRNLQVFTAEEVTQEWSVVLKSRTVKGPSSTGAVALKVEKDALNIYLARAAYEKGRLPMKLVNEIFNYSHMDATNPKHSEMCLHVALMEDNISQIIEMFADKGIPSLESVKFADEEEDAPEESEGPSWQAAPPVDKSEKKASQEKKDSGESKQKFRQLRHFGSGVGDVLLGVAAIPFVPFILVGALAVKASEEVALRSAQNQAAAFVTPATVSSVSAGEDRVLPGVGGNDGFQNFSKSVSKHLLPLRQKICSEDIALKGEIAVHRELARKLGENYKPQHHWTSKRRTKLSFPSFQGTQDGNSSFRFTDVDGKFTKLLAESSMPDAKNWLEEPPTYHLDVKSTLGDLRSAFPITPAQFHRARNFSVMMQQMKGEEGSVPADVYILVRVFDVGVIVKDEAGNERDDTKMAFLVDPWEYYHADKLVLKPKRLVGSVV